MYKENSSLRLIAVALTIAVAWGVVLIRPHFAPPTPPPTEALAARAPDTKPASAAVRPQPAQASVAPPKVDTTPDVGMLSDEQLTAEVAVVDRQIEDGDYIARANTGRLEGGDFEHFGALLARRDALHVAKIQRLIAAAQDIRAQHAP